MTYQASGINNIIAFSLDIVTNTDTLLNYVNLAHYLYTNGYNDYNKLFASSGTYTSVTENVINLYGIIIGLYSTNGSNILARCLCYNGDGSGRVYQNVSISTSFGITDIVTEI